ncbi:MAG: AAA family ATPase, partial [Alphaproteobacteria bacterium]|nr:AAA family ATPase [Alphaproteobacteria bacterium]
MEPIEQWLERLGLGRYGAAFVAAQIEPAMLRRVGDAELQNLGVSLGHRKKILRAIAALEPEPAAAAPAPAAERRQLTVAFCELIVPPAEAAALDPEDLRALIGAFHRRCMETITREGGIVAKYMGEQVLAYFGFPIAHEDDAERAVRAGLGLVGGGPASRLRVGIATGLVVVGDRIGEGAAREQGVVGETPNLAARLQALAGADAVVIADGTRRLLGRLFDYRDLGPVALKGFAEPQRAWQVLGPSRIASRFEALRSAGAPLAGRGEQAALLLRQWAQASGGAGRVVLVTGEPGIGKSRLASALREAIAAEPHAALRYFCSPRHVDSALQPFIDQLEHAAGFEPTDPAEVRIAKLQAVMQPLKLSAEQVGLLAELLVPTAAASGPAADRKQKIVEVWDAIVTALAANRPVLMLVEDAQWIDPTSRELLGIAAARAAALPVLMLVTARPEFLAPWPDAPHIIALQLTRLDRADAAALVDRVAGGRALPKPVLEQLLARADGVPLFLEELTRGLLESGQLREDGGQYVFAGPLPAPAIPATLHDTLMARLDRLGPAREVAQIGSALGRRFSRALIDAVAPRSAAELDAALERLTSADVLQPLGTAAAEYAFRHALLQDAAYATLLRGRRRPLHARIAAALEAQFQDSAEASPEALAHHFTEAGLHERAAGYWLRAGRQMLARSGMAEAEALLRRGLAVLAELPDGPARRERELDLQVALGQALLATQGYGAAAVGAVYARARQLCDELGRAERLPPILHGHVTHHFVRGELQEARRLAAELRTVAEARNDRVTQVMAYRASGFTALFSGRFAEARDDLKRGLALYRPADQAAYASLAIQDALVSLFGFSSLALACCGALRDARRRSDAALAEARRLAHTFSLAHALASAWRVGWLLRADPAALLLHADELLALSAAGGFALWRAFAIAHRGWCLAALGDTGAAVSLLTTSLAENEATGTGFQIPGVLVLLAEACRMAGQHHAALRHLAEAQRRAEQMQLAWLQAETLRLRGDLLLQHDRMGAESSYREALQLARDQGGRLFELRAATGLAQLWHEQGR